MNITTFSAHIPVPSGADQPEKDKAQEENRRKTLENLVKQLPPEATGVYLMGKDLFQGNAFWLTVAMGLGAAVLLFVRLGLKASWAVIATSTVSYVLWVYAIGNGPLQALFHGPAQTGVATFLIAVYTTLVTVAANNGWIK